MNQNVHVWVRRALAGIAALVLAAGTGCSSLSHHTVEYVGAKRYTASPADLVAILRAEPTRPFEKLGEVVLDSSLDPAPPIQKIEATLRREAAKLGADAVVLAYDRTQVMGSQLWGPPWAPSVSPLQDRLIVAIAIKYTQP